MEKDLTRPKTYSLKKSVIELMHKVAHKLDVSDSSLVEKTMLEKLKEGK